MPTTNQALRGEVRVLIVETLMLTLPAEEITDDVPLFGPGSLGLDSVDALQLVVALDKRFGLKISDAEVARRILGSVASVADAVASHIGRGDTKAQSAD